MLVGQPLHPFRGRDETEKTNSAGSGALQSGDGGRRASAGREHRIQHEKLALRSVTRDLEVVVDRLERLMVAIKTDVTYARGRYQSKYPLDHPQAGAQDRHQRQLLAGDVRADGLLERRFDVERLESQLDGGF